LDKEEQALSNTSRWTWFDVTI